MLSAVRRGAAAPFFCSCTLAGLGCAHGPCSAGRCRQERRPGDVAHLADRSGLHLRGQTPWMIAIRGGFQACRSAQAPTAAGAQRELDARAVTLANAPVPKSGQPWDASFLGRSSLLAALEELAQPLLQGPSWPTLEAYSSFAESERKRRAAELRPVQFAAPVRRQRSQPVELGQLYDGRIALFGEVPCVGSSYHDFLNVLAWAAFPRAKRALHARQYHALTNWLLPGSAQLPNRRTREQDALALFDEGGSVLVVAPELARRLAAAPAARHVLCEESGARLVPFGHALVEHVCFESAPVRSAALLLGMEPPLPDGHELLDRVDRAIAARLENPRELMQPSFDRVLSIEPPDAAHF
jgi:hypothetical protein